MVASVYQKSMDGTMQPATMLLVLFFTQKDIYCGNKMHHKLFEVNIALANNRCNSVCDISLCFILIGERVLGSSRQMIFLLMFLVQISTKNLSYARVCLMANNIIVNLFIVNSTWNLGSLAPEVSDETLGPQGWTTEYVRVGKVAFNGPNKNILVITNPLLFKTWD